jgi:hypothetical protein
VIVTLVGDVYSVPGPAESSVSSYRHWSHPNPAPLPLKFIFNSDLTNKRQSRIVCLSVGVSTGPAGRFPAFGKTKKLCPQD